MPLNQGQVDQLEQAILRYAFPGAYRNFSAGTAHLGSMQDVEDAICPALRSRHIMEVKDGLSNVLHWGYGQQLGRQRTRVDKFRADVTNEQLQEFMALISGTVDVNLISIKAIGLPEFSNVSFVSKILMFLDPDNCATLDLQIMKMATQAGSPLANVKLYRGRHNGRVTEQIPITQGNNRAYALWNATLGRISQNYYARRYRVVDIERGFFHLIQTDLLPDASQILVDA